ncbi:MAG: HEAT repeat domain-containing protein [bacterium]
MSRSSIRRLSAVLVVVIASAASAQNDAQPVNCPTGNDDVRVAALAGLAQLDAEQTLPTMKNILARKDACSVTLRRQVMGFVNRSRYGDQTDLFLSVARTDPNAELRRYAVQMLAQSNSERATSALDSIVFGSIGAELRDVALRSLSQQSSPAARASVHRAIELTTLPLEVRVRAINALGCCRRSPDETAYLIAFHAKADHPDLRDAAVRGIANQRTTEATNWLLGIARDKARDIEVRRQALSAIGQTVRANEGSSAGMDLKTLISLYDDFAGQVEMQDRMLDVISQHSETVATDKLLQVGRSEINVELRRKAVQRVGQRRDPRVREFLMEILGK